MRIELNAGGLMGNNISTFQTNLSNFTDKIDDVISSFQTIQRRTYNINGGIGSLENAIDSIQARIDTEKRKKQEISNVQAKFETFLHLTIDTDKKVSNKIEEKKYEFYKNYPHLKPPDPPQEKKFYEKIYDYAVGFIKSATEFIEETKDKLIDWYKNGGGKEIINIFYSLREIAVEIGVFVVGVASLTPPLTALGVTILVLDSAALRISSLNCMLDVGNEIRAIDKKKQAREAEANGDYELAQQLRKEASELSDTNSWQQAWWNDDKTNALDWLGVVFSAVTIIDNFLDIKKQSFTKGEIFGGFVSALDEFNNFGSSDFSGHFISEDDSNKISMVVDGARLFGNLKDFCDDIKEINNNLSELVDLAKDVSGMKTNVRELFKDIKSNLNFDAINKNIVGNFLNNLKNSFNLDIDIHIDVDINIDIQPFVFAPIC